MNKTRMAALPAAMQWCPRGLSQGKKNKEIKEISTGKEETKIIICRQCDCLFR